MLLFLHWDHIRIITYEPFGVGSGMRTYARQFWLLLFSYVPLMGELWRRQSTFTAFGPPSLKQIIGQLPPGNNIARVLLVTCSLSTDGGMTWSYPPTKMSVGYPVDKTPYGIQFSRAGLVRAHVYRITHFHT